jgi:AcrR family transcriptional regulator
LSTDHRKTPIRRGRPARISRDAIAAAALEVGFEALTFAAVADRLGVRAASLYHHVSGRDDLVGLALDRVVASVAPPERSEDWRATLHEEGWFLWRLADAHPGLAQAILPLAALPPFVAEREDALSAHLQRLGFGEEDAELAIDTVMDLAFDVLLRRDVYVRRRGPEYVSLGRRQFERKLEIVLDGIGIRLAPP